MNKMEYFGAALLLACVSLLAQAQQQAGVVSGRVVLDGKTSTSIEVVLLTEGNERRTEIARTSTDAEGRFRLNVEEAGRYRVMPFAPAYVSSNAQSVAKVITVGPGEEIKDVDFALVPGGVITGHVLTPDGRPAIACAPEPGPSTRGAGAGGGRHQVDSSQLLHRQVRPVS